MYEPKRSYKLNNKAGNVVYGGLYGWLSNHTCFILDRANLNGGEMASTG